MEHAGPAENMLFMVCRKLHFCARGSGDDGEREIHKQTERSETLSERAQGCVLGQLAGDALGSLVEFMAPEEIRKQYPEGLRELAAGGTWNTVAGQPTDDSEMALLLARMLVRQQFYQAGSALEAYRFWLDSTPFDCGATVSAGLSGNRNFGSQANGAMMRSSPLGIFGAKASLEEVAEWAHQDAQLTHPHQVCQDANVLFAMGIAHAIKSAPSPRALYDAILGWTVDLEVELQDLVKAAAENPPTDYVSQQGWVLIAFQNALYQLLHAADLEAGVVDTVMQGGDTDTNAAICGALLGSVYGLGSVPGQWVEKVLNCRPKAGEPGVHRPRAECFWPVDALELATALVSG